MELHLEAFDTIATGLLRDGWIRGYCRRVGVCSAIRAELWAIHNRLLIAWREGIMKVLLESDSEANHVADFTTHMSTTEELILQEFVQPLVGIMHVPLRDKWGVTSNRFVSIYFLVLKA
ncbi:hypothetical protein ERO13_A05G204350v2 [Gossypium hirsutum]|uniref:RNase H type-1 domain-containing protein n=2 Tax=Gossypium TaxID=3633 RepID=A0A2P5WDF8_GOSBA|nr:hypothetical protein ERO13_A05G204350v2 [Gossypium hirsutum]PPR89115.1 hypothetical protein GOBAR_AA31579 [Gossypium barbadense]TYH17785.1 hypothetical protein ES288_A05G218000v1 [Gossypium darwinii]